MATASPTPMPAYGSGAVRVSRHPSTRFVRRDSPAQSIIVAAQQRITDDSDDDLQPPPQLSDLGRSVLERQPDAAGLSPRMQQRMARATRVARTAPPESHTPARDTTTPAAPSQRVRRVGLQGAPVRRGKRTPQSEEEHGTDERPSQLEDHDDFRTAQTHRHENPPELDQENAPASTLRRPDSVIKKRIDSAQKPVVHHIEVEKKPVAIRERAEKPVALAPLSSNTPHRPAPPPPPKMSVLEAATRAAGASTTKKKSKKFTTFMLNGKAFTQYERCGKGGSAEVFKVLAENGKPFALKKVKLAGEDPMAIAGYKDEISILEKLRDVPRVVRLYDWVMEDAKEMLYVVSAYEFTLRSANSIS
jgi:serine/threonine-protein kinase TTK/MPS1